MTITPYEACADSTRLLETCTDTTVINLLSGISAVASDLYSVALPCIMTRHFGLPAAQKVALYVIFCLGLLVVGASAVRTFYLYEVGKDSDVSWFIYDAVLWAQLELQLGIMCAAAPALRVFFRDYLNPPCRRAVDATRSVVTRRSHREPNFSGVVVCRISGPDARYERNDFGTKHTDKPECDTTVVGDTEVESASPSSMAPSSHPLIKSQDSRRQPTTKRITCRVWKNTGNPRLGGQTVGVEEQQTSRSLSAASGRISRIRRVEISTLATFLVPAFLSRPPIQPRPVSWPSMSAPGHHTHPLLV